MKTLFLILFISSFAQAEVSDGWTITHYCSCKKCCGKTDGITASGKSAKDGTVALNWLPFGTKVIIDGKTYTVQDRGAKSLFGDKTNKIKHIDIWCKTHKEAVKKGIRKNVKVAIRELKK
jgi:3D (Asp-Asp-Asp) domain-containing protein